MVYKRKYVKRNYKKNYKKTGSITKIVKSVIQKQGENKFFDFEDLNNNMYKSTVNLTTDTPVVNDTTMFQIPQGDGVSSRDGNKIFIKGFSIKYNYVCTNSCSVRFMVVQYPGSSPTSSEWGIGLMGQLPRDLTSNYKVVKEGIYNFDPDNKGSVTGKMYIPVNKNITYESSTLSSPIKNNYSILCWTNNSTTNGLISNYVVRTFYRDT